MDHPSALIIANGTLPLPAVLNPLLDSHGYWLAVDGGANSLRATGITPDAVVGDLDSLDISYPNSVQRLSMPDQNYTDLDKAVAYLLGNGFVKVTMTGVTGSRLDHTFGSLSTLVKYGRLLDLALVDDVGTATLVNSRLQLAAVSKQVISLIAMGAVTGISTKGLHWNLENEDLAPGIRDGISNFAEDETVTILVTMGDLIVYRHHAIPAE